MAFRQAAGHGQDEMGLSPEKIVLLFLLGFAVVNLVVPIIGEIQARERCGSAKAYQPPPPPPGKTFTSDEVSKLIAEAVQKERVKWYQDLRRHLMEMEFGQSLDSVTNDTGTGENAKATGGRLGPDLVCGGSSDAEAHKDRLSGRGAGDGASGNGDSFKGNGNDQKSG